VGCPPRPDGDDVEEPLAVAQGGRRCPVPQPAVSISRKRKSRGRASPNDYGRGLPLLRLRSAVFYLTSRTGLPSSCAPQVVVSASELPTPLTWYFIVNQQSVDVAVLHA
jgi:hypothetical protein